ncbi:hypothetical protein [Burkholderia ambifaria]|nr:hypothetical protein [Burkholderia ambifaria]
MALTDVKIKNAKPSEKHSDGTYAQQAVVRCLHDEHPALASGKDTRVNK